MSSFVTFIPIFSASSLLEGAARQTPLNSNAIENILSELPDVSSEWLLMGKGSMLKAGYSKSISQIAGDNSLNALQLGNNNRQFISENASEPGKAVIDKPGKQISVDFSDTGVPTMQSKTRSEREQALEAVIAELKSQLKSQESMIEWMKEQHGWLKKQYEDQVERNKTLTSKSPSGE